MRRNLFLFFVFTCVILNAQTNLSGATTSSDLSDFAVGGTNGGWIKSGSVGSKIEGTQYLFENWATIGLLETKEGKIYKMPEMNYDAKLDNIVVKISKDSIFSFNPGTIKKVVINRRVFKRFLDPELNRNSFYEVISESKNMSLLKRNIKKIKEGSFNPMTQTKQTLDSYIIDEEYFLNSNGVLKKQALTKRGFLKIFDDKSTEIKNFIKENHLSIRKDKDLKKIFIYFDAI